jgi:hypothetical protein
MKSPRLLACFAPAALLIAGAASLQCQTIEGLLLDLDSGEPLAGTMVDLVQGSEVVERSRTDGEGRFVLAAPRPGTYRLHSARLGYAAGLTVPLELTQGQTRLVNMRLTPQAVVMDAVTVTRAPRPRLAERHVFYERRERLERSGHAHFVSREEIEDERPRQMTDILRMVPGLRISNTGPSLRQQVLMRGNCIPSIHIDGHLVRPLAGQTVNEMIFPEAVEGIEVYLTPGLAGRFVDPNPYTRPCGAIVIWTRERG